MIRKPPPATTPSFEKSAKPLLLALKPSRCWQWFLYLLHALCVVAVVISSIPGWSKALLLCLVAISFIYQHRQHQRLSQLVWRNGNRWFVDDEQTRYELASIDFFSRWLVILSVTPADSTGWYQRLRRTRKFMILFDSVDDDTFRLLRVRLRIEGFELLNPFEDSIR